MGVEAILIALVVLAALLVARGGAAESAAAAVAPALFAALALVAITAVWFPAPYEALADAGLRAAGLHQRLRDLDAAVPVDALAERTAGLWDRVTDLLGQAGPAPEASEAPAEPGSDVPGLVERSLYPGLVGVVALIVRAGALAASLAGMVATVALGWAAGALRAGRRAREQAAALEERVAALERRASGAPPR